MLYFIPGKKMVTAQDVRAMGMGYILGPDGVTSHEVSSGIDGQPGVIFSASIASPRYVPDSQTWKKHPDSKRDLWCGYNVFSPPTPRDFAKETMLDGHRVKLGDGNEWLIPVARRLSGDTPLPRALEFDGNQWSAGEVQPKFREYYGHALQAWDAIMEAEQTGTLDLDFECNLSAMALGMNYRIGAVEISALGLFDTTTEQKILKAIVDFPLLEELKKKIRAGA